MAKVWLRMIPYVNAMEFPDDVCDELTNSCDDIGLHYNDDVVCIRWNTGKYYKDPNITYPFWNYPLFYKWLVDNEVIEAIKDIKDKKDGYYFTVAIMAT